MSKLRLSNRAAEGTLNVSKWLKTQVLLSAEEMEKLLGALGIFSFYNVSEVVSSEDAEISREAFLAHYREYVTGLKEGRLPEEKTFRRYFSSVMSVTPDVFYADEVQPRRFLVKPTRPVIQLQSHHFLHSKIDGKFYPMTLSQESVTWGIQFSYPQIFQHPKSQAFSKVGDDKEFPNTSLFSKLTKWLRNFSAPTTFIYEGKSTSVPIRTGKEVFSWIQHHPQLKPQGLSVHVY